MPVHSERESIIEIISQLKQLINQDTLHEVILTIAKASPLETMEICKKMVNDNDFVKMYIQNEPGFGMAYREAFKLATGDYILMLDSDGEFELATIPKMINAAEVGNYDVIQASRWITGGGADGYEFFTYIANRLFQYIFRILLWTKIHDLTFGYKMIKRSVINEINWEGRRHELAMETTIKPIKYGYRVVEVSSYWRKRREGESKNPGVMRVKLYTPLALKVVFAKNNSYK